MSFPLRATAVVTLTMAMLALAVLPALAHVAFNPSRLAPGEQVDAQLVVTHGCGVDGGMPAQPEDAVATTAVELTVPPSVTVLPGEADGWEAQSTPGTVVWANQSDEGADGTVSLPVTVRAHDEAEVGDVLRLPVTQVCGGVTADWHDTAAGAPLPTPSLTLAAEAGDDRPVPWSAIAGLAVLALAAGGAAAVFTLRRG